MKKKGRKKKEKKKKGGKKALDGRAKGTYAKLRVNPPVNESSYSHLAIIGGGKAGKIASRPLKTISLITGPREVTRTRRRWMLDDTGHDEKNIKRDSTWYG